MDRFIEGNPFYGPRTAEKFEKIQAIVRAEIEAQRVERMRDVIIILTVIGVAALLAAYFLFRNRQKIARAADAAVVAALAKGVMAARSAGAKRDALIARVLAKAAEKPTSQE